LTANFRLSSVLSRGKLAYMLDFDSCHSFA